VLRKSVLLYREVSGHEKERRRMRHGHPYRKRKESSSVSVFLCSSPNIVRVIKSRRMRWVGHVARMGEERGCVGSWWGSRKERDHWGDLGVDGWIILGWISGGGMWVYGLDWAGPG